MAEGAVGFVVNFVVVEVDAVVLEEELEHVVRFDGEAGAGSPDTDSSTVLEGGEHAEGDDGLAHVAFSGALATSLAWGACSL